MSFFLNNLKLYGFGRCRPPECWQCLGQQNLILPHQLLHRRFQSLDRDRIHPLREDAANDG
ncbi:MAG: hypothetical protein E6848_38660, partial [Bradyrhizobium sp.]|nr:hypothetical protein [Bradyrhizobium sp.]